MKSQEHMVSLSVCRRDDGHVALPETAWCFHRAIYLPRSDARAISRVVEPNGGGRVRSQNCRRRASLVAQWSRIRLSEGGREGDARGKRYGDICICIIDSLCYKAETSTPL